MEKKSKRILGDVPTELIHRVQSLLSEKEAARTCVLSKSWLHAWSTIPILRFPSHHISLTHETKNNKLVYNTIQRYHNNNVPIHTLDFEFHVRDQKADENWIRPVIAAASKTTSCLKLCIWVLTDSGFTFPDDMLFSGEKLQSINVIAADVNMDNPLCIGIDPLIKCVSLRVLELDHVNISQHVLHNLLTTCTLLEKLILCFCDGLQTVKVKNLPYLRHLDITSIEEYGELEIDSVPSLDLFHYHSLFGAWKKPLPFKTTGTTAVSLGRSVTQLHLDGMILDGTFFDMIKSSFLSLQRLKLGIGYWAHESLVITSLSLKRLTLCLYRANKLIDLQVYAPKLLSFDYDYNGNALPTLLFPAIAHPKQIKLTLSLRNPLDTCFFLKLREVLNLSSKFDIHIKLDSSHESLVSLNTDDLRRRVSFPVTNVQQLYLTKRLDDQLWEHTRFFDALFSICRPVHVKAYQHMFNDINKCFSRLMARGVMGKKTTGLKDFQLKSSLSGRREALTSSWETDALDTFADPYYVDFKLNWFSHE